MMDKQGLTITALTQKSLLKDIIENNMVFFRDTSSSYDTAKLGELRLTPTKEMLTELKQDYKAMEIMMIKNYPTFEELISAIEALEKQLNCL